MEHTRYLEHHEKSKCTNDEVKEGEEIQTLKALTTYSIELLQKTSLTSRKRVIKVQEAYRTSN
jgi:hypothetical protein